MSRIMIQRKLEKLCDHVYFQPTSNTKLVYPCIVYNRSSNDNRYGNDGLYLRFKSYEATVISIDPDSEITDELERTFPYTSFTRQFITDNLRHDVLTIYDAQS